MFSYEQGLNIAAAFTAYDDVEEPILDESIGELVFKAYTWGLNEETGKYEVSRNVIKSHTC